MEEKFAQWRQLKRERGLSFNAALSQKHDFLNPNIGALLLDWAQVDEYGTRLDWHSEAELAHDAQFDYEAVAAGQRAEWETRSAQERPSMVFRHSMNLEKKSTVEGEDKKSARMKERINAAVASLPTIAKRKQ